MKRMILGKPWGLAICSALLLSTTFSLEAANVVYLLDVGGPASAPVNSGGVFYNVLSTTAGMSNSGTLNGLVDSTGIGSSINLGIVRRFNDINGNGTTSAGAPFPSFATGDSLFGNTSDFNGLTNVFPAFQLTGLNTSLAYNLEFYASRTGVADIRETGYTVTGLNSGFTALDASNNVSNIASVLGITPTAGGTITVALAPTAANNNNPTRFTYLGVLRLTAVPEPSRAFLGMMGLCLLARRRRRAA